MNLFAGEPERIPLGKISRLEHFPGWLDPDGATSLLANLTASASWEQRKRWMINRHVLEPKLTAEYDNLAAVPDSALSAPANALTDQYQVPYDGPWINYYREPPGQHWLARRLADLQATGVHRPDNQPRRIPVVFDHAEIRRA